MRFSQMDIQKYIYNIQGMVQGVGFRQFIYEKARRLGVKGYVKNCQDGSVECLAEGNTKQLKELHKALNCGPNYSRVDRVLQKKSNLVLTQSSFVIQY